eukprot:5124095-Amphidinium_carterae.1
MDQSHGAYSQCYGRDDLVDASCHPSQLPAQHVVSSDGLSVPSGFVHTHDRVHPHDVRAACG